MTAWVKANHAEDLAKSNDTARRVPPSEPSCAKTTPRARCGWEDPGRHEHAPLAIAKDATVIDWPAPGGGDLVVLRKGTNNWTCYPDWTASPATIPNATTP